MKKEAKIEEKTESKADSGTETDWETAVNPNYEKLKGTEEFLWGFCEKKSAKDILDEFIALQENDPEFNMSPEDLEAQAEEDHIIEQAVKTVLFEIAI